jgi:hypothetical protein
VDCGCGEVVQYLVSLLQTLRGGEAGKKILTGDLREATPITLELITHPSRMKIVKLQSYESEFGKFLNVLTRYEQKKDLLNNISYDDKPYFQCLVRKWKDDSSLYRVQGNLFYGSYTNRD